MASRIKDNVISLSRLYDAPLQAVWDAWTQPDEVAQWWGPRGFTITTHSKDLRPGGHWDYTMHGPDGTDWHAMVGSMRYEWNLLLGKIYGPRP